MIPMPMGWWDWAWLIWRVFITVGFLGTMIWGLWTIRQLLSKIQIRTEILLRTEALLLELKQTADRLDEKIDEQVELTKDTSSTARATLDKVADLKDKVVDLKDKVADRKLIHDSEKEGK